MSLVAIERNARGPSCPLRFEIVISKYDASRPYAVIATFRSFNRVMGRYETEVQAKRRVSDLNRRS